MHNPTLSDVALSAPNNFELSDYHVMNRKGVSVPFDPKRIELAINKAMLAVHGEQVQASSSRRQKVLALTHAVVHAIGRQFPGGGFVPLEFIQDQVERALMQADEHEVARSYVLYREKRAAERAAASTASTPAQATILVKHLEGIRPLAASQLRSIIQDAAQGLGPDVDAQAVFNETIKNLYDGVTIAEVEKALILAARTRIEQAPAYSTMSARLLLRTLVREVLGKEAGRDDLRADYPKHLATMVLRGVKAGLLDERLASYDLERLGAALKPERDDQFTYLGLQTLYDRYFLHVDNARIELPQSFFMRVAMGLALNEDDFNGRAIEFYELLSSFDFMSSTPTLFNSGTTHSQLSSCYLSTVDDDLAGIYEAIKDNALLSKFAGGLGNDWTPVRAMGSHIKGTNGQSQGVVPFLKVVNDSAIAVNQGGKRKGAVCAYLESWHLDIEEFLELRKNTGDDRRRTHDMNTANWIPDLFMKRVINGEDWTLFSPSDCPDLHDKYGSAFEEAYIAYEAQAAAGEIKLFKTIPALTLWRKMLSMLFETGHPWITFKDPCNIRSPQQHVGVVHSSNLCTEITLNTSLDEIAVCNLGSVNLSAHLKQDAKGQYVLDHEKLRATVRVAMRMLDNVIDINFYAVDKARTSNFRHRPVGLGVMGFQDCLHQMRVPFASDEAVAFSDTSMEALCYYAYETSSDLAAERGAYSTFEGSLWSQGILPLDTLDILGRERGGHLQVDMSATMDWEALREKIQRQGMRNSNCVAIAPTATISNIIGVSPCIEPNYRNLYVKSNLSGEFTVVNPYLVNDLKALGLWDDVMVADLKYFDGSVQTIDRVPAALRRLYATAFEIEPEWVVECAARRAKWIDQAQSLNIFMSGVSGKKLDEVYKLAWVRGLKTTYYLRSQGATAAEKSTGQGGELNAVSAQLAPLPEAEVMGAVCSMRPGDEGFEECEACQ